MNLFFVFNPKAGKEKVKAKLGDIIELFSVEGHKVSIAATTKRGNATELVQNLDPSIDRVICSGGDGTLDEVVSGLSKLDRVVPLGYIPAGSTNDFANSVGIPSRMMDAARVSLSDNIFKCDVGKFNDKVFVYVAAFGAFTEVSYATPQDMKNRLGHTAYLIEAMRSVPEIKPYHMVIKTDNMTLEDDFIYGMITNSDSVGGIKKITGENVNLSDGLFEVTLIKKPKGPVELNAVIGALLNHDLTAKDLFSFKTERISFSSTEEVPWTLDGEFGGKEKEVSIVNLNQALSLAVKKTK